MEKRKFEALKRKLLQELEVQQQNHEELKRQNAALKQRVAFSPGTKEKEKDG